MIWHVFVRPKCDLPLYFVRYAATWHCIAGTNCDLTRYSAVRIQSQIARGAPQNTVASQQMVSTRERGKRPTSSAMDQAEVSKRAQRSSARGTSTTALPAGKAPKPVRSDEPQPPSDSRRSDGAKKQSGKVLACFPHRPH